MHLVKDVEAGSSLGDSRVTESPPRDGYNGSRSLTAAALLSTTVQLNTQVVSSLYYGLSWMTSAECQNWSVRGGGVAGRRIQETYGAFGRIRTSRYVNVV